MSPEVGCSCDLRNLEALHLVLGKALLHANADEVLAVFGKSIKYFHQGQNLLIRFFTLHGVVFNSVYKAATALNIRDPSNVLLIDHLKASGSRESEHNSEIKEVDFLELFEGSFRRETICVALLHQSGVASFNLVLAELCEFLLYQTLPRGEVFK